MVKIKPKAKLAVAGIIEKQKYVEDFQKMVSRYSLSKNIVFLGEQKESSLRNLVKSSKLTLNPSMLDPFSLVTLESLACGIPVVAYNIPAIKNIFGLCDAVLRCPIGGMASMAKNVQFLLENEDLRTKLSKEAREYASNYDWRKVIRAEKEAYFKVIRWFISHTGR